MCAKAIKCLRNTRRFWPSNLLLRHASSTSTRAPTSIFYCVCTLCTKETYMTLLAPSSSHLLDTHNEENPNWGVHATKCICMVAKRMYIYTQMSMYVCIRAQVLTCVTGILKLDSQFSGHSPGQPVFVHSLSSTSPCRMATNQSDRTCIKPCP